MSAPTAIFTACATCGVPLDSPTLPWCSDACRDQDVAETLALIDIYVDVVHELMQEHVPATPVAVTPVHPPRSARR